MTRTLVFALAAAASLLGPSMAWAQQTIRVGWTIPAEEAKYWMMRRPDQFPDLGKGYKVEWVQFQGTAPMVQAMAAGALDCSTQGVLSMAQGAIQANLETYIVAQHVGEKPGSFSVYWAVKDDSPIKTIADFYSALMEHDKLAALPVLRDLPVLVVVGENDGSLAMIERIVKEAACPVIAILDVEDAAFVDQAARLGIFAYIADGMDEQELQSSIDIALRRFAEYHALEGAFGRRALTERAKGILMERHDLSEQEAFNMLRDHARRSSRKVVDIAQSVVESRSLLPGREHSSSGGESDPAGPTR